ncbi:MAG: diaminopimelate decarboxylase [Ruminococcaceae bacterium]|nr:diaminopimelate decarboxylase [Oscillospiraceae bacterium]
MKKLFFNKEQAEVMAKEYGTPYYVYDEKGMVEGIRRLQKAFSWNKGYKEYYAIKACANPHLIKIMMDEGCGVDCSSYTELMIAEALGAKGENIMFSSNATPAEDFVYARELDSLINLDDITHIEFLEANGGLPETVCLRYNPGGDFKVGNAIMGNPGEAKYGMTRVQLTEAVKKLMAKGVKYFGLHAFLASNMIENGYYASLAAILFETVVEVNKETGAKFTFVNLSGGIGIPYRPEEKPVDLEVVGQGVKEAYERIITPSALGDVAIKTELGRYITGPHGVLVSRAVHRKDTYRHYIGLDACAANLMRPAMYGAYHHITVLGKEDAPCDHVYDITGGLCENNDKFAIDRSMPEIEMGDLLAIHDAGAHGFSMGYNYNGKLHSCEILLKEDGSTKLIRRAEQPKDYFATFDFDDTMTEVIKKR